MNQMYLFNMQNIASKIKSYTALEVVNGGVLDAFTMTEVLAIAWCKLPEDVMVDYLEVFNSQFKDN